MIKYSVGVDSSKAQKLTHAIKSNLIKRNISRSAKYLKGTLSTFTILFIYIFISITN